MANDRPCIGKADSLGELLIKTRERYGLSKKQMAEKFGFDESTYGRIENGITQRIKTKDIEKLKAMAPYIGVPFSELLASAGISSDMKKEIFYDFEGNEINYFSAIKGIYSADPNLFFHLEKINSLSLDRIKYVEKIIDMLLEEERNSSKLQQIVAESVMKYLDLYFCEDKFEKTETAKDETMTPNDGVNNDKKQSAVYAPVFEKTEEPVYVEKRESASSILTRPRVSVIRFTIGHTFRICIRMTSTALVSATLIRSIVGRTVSNITISYGRLGGQEKMEITENGRYKWETRYNKDITQLEKNKIESVTGKVMEILEMYGPGEVSVSRWRRMRKPSGVGPTQKKKSTVLGGDSLVF